MSPELLTGIVGAIGATIGATGVVVGNLVAGRAQRRQALELAEGERAHTRDQAQRERQHAQRLAEEERQHLNEQAAVTQRQQEAEYRRSAYVTYLASLAVFQSSCRELADEMARARPDDLARCHDIHQRYMANWHDMVKNQAAVEILGPRMVTESCWILGRAIGAFSYICDVWYARIQVGEANNRWSQFHDKEAVVNERREHFIAETRPVVSGEVVSTLAEEIPRPDPEPS